MYNERKLDIGNRSIMTAKKRFIAEIICLINPRLYPYYKSIYNNTNKVYEFIGDYETLYTKRALKTNIETKNNNSYSYYEIIDIYDTDYYEDKPNVKKYIATIKKIVNKDNDYILSHEILNSIYDINSKINLGEDSLYKYQCMSEILCFVYPELRNEWENRIDHKKYDLVKAFVNKYRDNYNNIIVHEISNDVYDLNSYEDDDFGCTLIINRINDDILSIDLQKEGECLYYGKEMSKYY